MTFQRNMEMFAREKKEEKIINSNITHTKMYWVIIDLIMFPEMAYKIDAFKTWENIGFSQSSSEHPCLFRNY